MEPTSKEKINKKKSTATVLNNVRDYSNEPFFVKKGKASEAFLNKYGFPKELIEKR